LLVVSEAYRAADLAKSCGDVETSAKLRARARAWATLQDDGTFGVSAALGASLSELASGRPEAATRSVMLEIRQLPDGAREVWALVDVLAPSEFVWRTLTDYERLSDIVPSLQTNRVVSRWAGGVRLEQARCGFAQSGRVLIGFSAQVAAQDVGLGIKFSATATLDIEELPSGILLASRTRCAFPSTTMTVS
jgi:hypothetical protein